MTKIRTVRHAGLWVAIVPTEYGYLELLIGEGNEPDLRMFRLAEMFLEAPGDPLAQVRKSAFWLAWMWQPIRIAVNDRGRLGVQFKERFSGTQKGMYFADEHSSFSTRLSDVEIGESEVARLKGLLRS
jgi:hypothetical protein